MTTLKLPKIISGDGNSLATVIRFEPCDLKTRKAAERQYICQQYGEEKIDWTSGIHMTLAPFSSPVPNQLADLFRTAYEQVHGSHPIEKLDEKDSEPIVPEDFSGLVSLWNIELADGASKRIYFDTSNTIYDE